MRISIELFLLDNLLMDLLLLRLACVFCGARFRFLPMLCASCGAAIYALLSVTLLPFLSAAVPKLALGCALALPLVRCRQDVFKAVASVYVSAFLMGGLMIACTQMFGGGISGGALMGTVSARVMLIALSLCALTPRLIRELIRLYDHRVRLVPLRIRLHDRVLTLEAFVDSGNELTEPISGRPVIIVKPGMLPKGGRPVGYDTVVGKGIMYAQDALCIQADVGYAVELDAMVAEAPGEIRGAEAIVPASLIERTRRTEYASETKQYAETAVHPTAAEAEKRAALHPLGRDAAGAVSAGGGADMD